MPATTGSLPIAVSGGACGPGVAKCPTNQCCSTWGELPLLLRCDVATWLCPALLAPLDVANRAADFQNCSLRCPAGFCGVTAEHCDSYCQKDFSGSGARCEPGASMDATTGLPIARSGGACGPGVAMCPSSQCCSTWGEQAADTAFALSCCNLTVPCLAGVS